MSQCRVELFEQIFEEKLFKHQKQRKIKSPDDKIPLGPVPKARKEPHNDNIAYPFERAYAVAAHWNVNVIAKPGSERHMPSSPKLRQALGYKRVVEVFEK